MPYYAILVHDMNVFVQWVSFKKVDMWDTQWQPPDNLLSRWLHAN